MNTAPAPIPHGRAPHRLTNFLLVTLVVLAALVVVLVARNEWGGSSGTADEGSGTTSSETRSLPPFTSVTLAGSNLVTVQVGETQKVVVHADDNLIERVTTEVRGGELVISEWGSFEAKSPMSVDVTVPALDALTLSGSGIVTVRDLRTAELVVRAPGSGILNVSGTATRLDASLIGSGDIQLQDLVARDASASVSGSGRMQVHATRTLDASISGSGAIFYSGDPQLTQSISGSGAIIPQ